MREKAALLVAMAGVALLTGCSLLEEQAGETSSGSSPEAARTAFSVELATICQEHLVPLYDAPDQPTAAEQATFFTFARDSTLAVVEEVEELTPPPGDEERVSSLLADLEAYAALSERIIPALQTGTVEAVMAEVDPEIVRLEESLDAAFEHFDVESCEV